MSKIVISLYYHIMLFGHYLFYDSHCSIWYISYLDLYLYELYMITFVNCSNGSNAFSWKILHACMYHEKEK